LRLLRERGGRDRQQRREKNPFREYHGHFPFSCVFADPVVCGRVGTIHFVQRLH
jgi:hypothetical protein